MEKPHDFPKLHSPFKRETKLIKDGEVVGEPGDDVEHDEEAYVVTPEVAEGYEWVFEEAEKVQAIEKLDGTNVSVIMEDGKPKEVWARLGSDEESIGKVPFWTKQYPWVIKGVMNAYQRGWLDDLEDGQHFGELVGPNVGGAREKNVNPYELEEHLFYPFERAREVPEESDKDHGRLEHKTYGMYGTEYEDVQTWFMEEGLIPLFYSRRHGKGFKEMEEDEGFVEGIVFYHPETGDMAKLRRDMFPSFIGGRH